jgi:hypothetical protein
MKQKQLYNTGSPPPAESKKVVLKFLSVNSLVIAPAKTGNDNNSRESVIKIDRAERGSLWRDRCYKYHHAGPQYFPGFLEPAISPISPRVRSLEEHVL